MKAVILAGGRGTRLAPYTSILPKPLMPIGDMPILEVMLKQMKKAGVDEVILTVGHLASLLRAYFGYGEQWDIKIQYSYEREPLGTAGPLALVKDLDSVFLVTNGDVLTTLNFKDLLDFHQKEGGIATIAVHRRQVRIDLGVVESDSSHVITGYVEKPTFDYTVSMGIYVFDPRVLEYIPANQYLDFPNLVLKLISANEKVVAYPYDGYWMDLGRPDDYEQAGKDFGAMRTQFLPEE